MTNEQTLKALGYLMLVLTIIAVGLYTMAVIAATQWAG